jgi:hypothetical protein
MGGFHIFLEHQNLVDSGFFGFGDCRIAGANR